MGMAFATAERIDDGARFASGNLFVDAGFVPGAISLRVRGTLVALAPRRSRVGDCIVRIWEGPAEILSLPIHIDDPVENGSPIMVTFDWTVVPEVMER